MGTVDEGSGSALSSPGPRVLPAGFHFGVATAGFQVEGGFNGPGEPANNWAGWERSGRIEPSGNAVGFFDRPEESLDRAAELGCTSFRLGLEWARVEPQDGVVDRGALERYGVILEGCRERGMEPLVTLHHFTHPEWLGDEFWLRPDAPRRFAAWAETALSALGDRARLWVTINEINALALGSWLLGMFPPGRRFALADAAVAADNLLAAHVLAYEVVHRWRPDAVVTTNSACLSLYDLDRLHTDLLVARSLGVARSDLDSWIDERRRAHDRALPPPTALERALRRLAGAVSSHGRRAPERLATPGRAVDAVYQSPHDRTLDVVGLDFYDPLVSRHFRLPGRRTAGGRRWGGEQALWDDVCDPGLLRSWLGATAAALPGLDIWVVENGLANRVRNGRSYPRVDGWDRGRYLREYVGAVVGALEDGVPVTGYWHWSLVDNYEWGSYEPRFGLFGIDRSRGARGFRWLETDAMGERAAATYRDIVTGLKAGDRTVVHPG